ncbi:MAG: hypothetical protein MUC36_18980 [Planctomycetes bacterium]|jgi:hypothetical protein|nr:hypothetical protein [Planctomycetota bacterium]
MIVPIPADPLFADRPGLFPAPLPPIADRRTMQIGERIKVLVGIREAEQRLRGRWYVVAAQLQTEPQPRFLGADPEQPDSTCEFGPEHVYRIEPRLFTIWGDGGRPRAVRGQASADGAFHAPIDHDERPLAACDEVILRYRANGYRHARRRYEELRQATWPEWDELG